MHYCKCRSIDLCVKISSLVEIIIGTWHGGVGHLCLLPDSMVSCHSDS